MKLEIKDTFNKQLPFDSNRNNTRRQVFEACGSYAIPRKPSAPQLIHHTREVAELLGISQDQIASQKFIDIFSGAKTLEHSDPYAMCYGGHQFGHWTGQLGDGRAINLAEVEFNNKRWALQLKGAGETPYSRTADGLAVLRSSIREHLCSEAMFHLGVPTTRSLSLMLTGDKVMRDIMYDGHPALEKGAVVCRVSPSFIRFGNFQIFTSRKDFKNLKILADYTIKHFFSEITSESEDKYVQFLEAVSTKTLKMVIDWQRVGFVHGVMNTDNMSILGLTIDYGPYGWIEDYDKEWTPNTTDRQNRRYKFGNQPSVAHWNIYQLANALYPLTEDAAPLEAVLKKFQEEYSKAYLKMMRSKLGLILKKESDLQLISELEKTLQLEETDMTIFYRLLSQVKAIDTESEALNKIEFAFYDFEKLEDQTKSAWLTWFNLYTSRLKKESISEDEKKENMDLVNPKYVLRNYMAQLAIEAADKGDYSIISELHELLKQPYAEQTDQQKWFAKRPEWAKHKVGCSMLSCSS